MERFCISFGASFASAACSAAVAARAILLLALFIGGQTGSAKECSGYLHPAHPYYHPHLRRRLPWEWFRWLTCPKQVPRLRSSRCSTHRRSCYPQVGRILDHQILAFQMSDVCEFFLVGRRTLQHHGLDHDGSLWKHGRPLFVAGFSTDIERVARIERREGCRVGLVMFASRLEQYGPHDFPSSYGCSMTLWWKTLFVLSVLVLGTEDGVTKLKNERQIRK